MTDILKLAEQVWGTDKWTQAQSERIQRFYDLAIADYRAKLIGVSVEPALYVPPKRDGEFHHEHASVAGYRSPTAGWEPLYTEEALAAAKLQAREEYRQELLGESVEPVAHVVSGIRKSGLEPGQSSPASIMRMSVEMSAP